MKPTTLSTATGAELQAETETVQGAWVSVAGQRSLRLFFAGHRFTASFVDGRLYMGSFELRLDDEPRIMIMYIDEGPAKHKGQTAWCIYDLEMDQLRWC